MMRATWLLVGALAVGMCVVGLGFAAAAHAGVRSEGARERLADQLIRRDPGALVGGNTQVATAAGARVFGVPERMNFMVALGPRERIVGGANHDQLGALDADGARIDGGDGPDLIHGLGRDAVLAGGAGNDLIYGGPGRARLIGGAGNDRLIDKRGAAVVLPGPGSNEVDVADGEGDDRVVCTPGSTNRIDADRGDRLTGCRSASGYRTPPSPPPHAHTAQSGVSGNGSDQFPLTQACADPQDDPCTTPIFGPFELAKGFLSTFPVDAFQCPSDHRWLYNQDYAPFGTSLDNGVQVNGLGPVGLVMIGVQRDGTGRDIATTTENASATNWTLGQPSYSVQLHCTYDDVNAAN